VKERIEVTTEVGVVALGDSQAVLPSGLDQDALLRQLEPMAHSGSLFFLVTDDPATYRIDLVVGEPSPPGPDRDFEGLGGVFRLDVPSGRVALSGWDKSGQPADVGAIALPPGTQLVSVLTRRPFDGPRHVNEMSELLGDEWHYMDKVNKLGLVGCLPLALTAMVILARQWHWLWYVVPLLAVSWLPVLILKRGERFKAAEQRARELERARPDYVISLTATPEKGLSGGFVRV